MSSSDGVVAGLAGADAYGLLHIRHENLAVADATRLRRGDDRVDGLFHHAVAEHELKLYLGQEIDHVFGATIELGMALLASEPLGFGDGNALQTDLLQGFFDLIQLERFNDRLDFFHVLHRTSPLGNTEPLKPRAFVRTCRTPAAAQARPMPILSGGGFLLIIPRFY